MRDFRVYLRLLTYARPFWKLALLSFFSMLLTASLEASIPGLMRPLVDEGLIRGDPRSAWVVPALIAAVFMLKGVSDYFSTVLAQTVAQRTVAEIRERVFSHMMDLPLAIHHSQQFGRMQARISSDVEMVADAVSSAWLILIRDTLVLLGLISFVFYTSWQLSLVLFLFAPSLAWVLRSLSRSLRSSNRRLQDLVGDLNTFVTETLLGLREIKIFCAHKSRAEGFYSLNRSLLGERLRLVKTQALNVPLVQTFAAMSVAGVVYLALLLNRENLLTPGEFVAFVTAMTMIFEPIRRIANVNATLQRGLAGAESIFWVLDGKAEGQDRSLISFPRRRNLSDDLVGDPSQSDRGSVHIQFKQVAFKYTGQARSVLQNFSLSVRFGEVVALVGPSGSGKSTALNLLAGFLSPCNGDIIISGRSIRSIRPSEIRSQMALVSQRVILFNQTIFSNILIGRPSATHDEVMAAARAAHALDFIQRLPQGLNTHLGSLGERLSGGERQRIAIARALLKNAPILLLDEATSALDRGNEEIVLQGLRTLMAGRTVILISHSSETLLDVDRVINIAGSDFPENPQPE